jgi:hypothetical protein
MTSHFQEDWQKKLGRSVDDAIDHHVLAFTEGLKSAMIGLEVVDVKGEVWSAEGHFGIVITLSDGSIIESPATTRAAGPLADLIRMAGGNPFGSEEEEASAIKHGWKVGE